MMGRGAVCLGAALALTVVGCEGEVADVRPQWTIVIGTDAPVPQLGDRLLLEILDEQGESACSGCRRQLGVARPDQWPISFGVVPPEGGGELRVRARLYRSGHTGYDGLPGSDLILDAVGRLPPVQGVTLVGLELRMDCFGVPANPADKTTCDPATGEPGAEPDLPILEGSEGLPLPGSWPTAAGAPCAGEVPQGMVCIPGGVFLLGSPHGVPLSSESNTLPEHLTRLSPFALDVDEVTVGQIRELVASGGTTPPLERMGEPGSNEDACTYLGVDDPGNDDLPVNCVSFAQAEQACVARGKRLPTEAEWEYAAGNTTTETAYPWGSDDDVCSHSIVARGRVLDAADNTLCLSIGGTTNPSGPVAGGHALDVTSLGVKNMGGNMDEWTADQFAPFTAACWNPGARVLVNPRCDDGGGRSIRGSSWAFYPFAAKAFERNASTLNGPTHMTGLRCAKSM
jgi:formylglycine-generating enzyme required for sulfatase activity